MAEVKWSEFPQDLTALPENSEIVLLKDGENKRAPGVNWKGDKGDKGDTGDTGATGAQGPQGDPGADGNDGAPGADGNTVLSGARVPTGGDGVDGDWWINTVNYDIYGPKTSGNWGSPTSLVGPQGATGADGADGADGMTVLNGTGAPAGGLGKEGDFYIDTAVWDIYGPKTGGSWGVGTSLIGPQGPQGDPGTGYILQGSATVATLNGLTAGAIGDSYAWIMLDAGTVQPIGGAGGTAVVADDLVVWAAPSLIFINYGNQSGGGGGDVTGPGSSVANNITTFLGTSGKAIQDSGVGIDKVNTALQPGANNSELVNDSNYVTLTVGDARYATAAQGATADTATQPGDNLSTLTNDEGFKRIDYGTSLPDPSGYSDGDFFAVHT